MLAILASGASWSPSPPTINRCQGDIDAKELCASFETLNRKFFELKIRHRLRLSMKVFHFHKPFLLHVSNPEMEFIHLVEEFHDIKMQAKDFLLLV